MVAIPNEDVETMKDEVYIILAPVFDYIGLGRVKPSGFIKTNLGSPLNMDFMLLNFYTTSIS